MINNKEVGIDNLLHTKVEMPTFMYNVIDSFTTPHFLEIDGANTKRKFENDESRLREKINYIVNTLNEDSFSMKKIFNDLLNNGNVAYVGAIYAKILGGVGYLIWSEKKGEEKLNFCIKENLIISKLIKNNDLIILDYHNSHYSNFFHKNVSFIERKSKPLHKLNKNEPSWNYIINLAEKYIGENDKRMIVS